MPHKLDPFKQQILDLKAAGDSVREISRKLSKASGERIAPSTVQHACKMWSHQNGESKKDSEIDASILQGRIDSLEVLVGELQARLEQPDTGMSRRPKKVDGGGKSRRVIV